MQNYAPVLAATALCCGVPLLCIYIGFLIGRHGMPLSVRWNWKQSSVVEEQD
jgi:hypothetical protein